MLTMFRLERREFPIKIVIEAVGDLASTRLDPRLGVKEPVDRQSVPNLAAKKHCGPRHRALPDELVEGSWTHPDIRSGFFSVEAAPSLRRQRVNKPDVAIRAEIFG
jgi:hypothetical protein